MITGASSGIGLEFAHQLGARGHALVLVSPEAERLEEVRAELARTYGVEAEAVVADLSVRADVARVAGILVNNAGFGLQQWFLDNERADEEALLDVLCRAVLVVSHAAGRAMRDRGGGTIVNVASVAGWVAGGTYSAAKSWVIAFSESLAAELATSGVTVTVLCPGLVRTEFHRRSRITVDKPEHLWLDARRVVRECLADAGRGRVISVPSPLYKGLAFLARVAPRRFVRSGGKLTAHRPPPRCGLWRIDECWGTGRPGLPGGRGGGRGVRAAPVHRDRRLGAAGAGAGDGCESDRHADGQRRESAGHRRPAGAGPDRVVGESAHLRHRDPGGRGRAAGRRRASGDGRRLSNRLAGRTGFGSFRSDSFWARQADRVTRKPWLAGGFAVVLLALLAAPATDLRLEHARPLTG